MPKIKLTQSYRSWSAGEILETDKAKCEALVSRGSAKFIEEAANKMMEPKKRGRPKKYNTKL